MTEDSLVTLEFTHDRKAAHVTLDRPDKVNAVTPGMASELASTVEEVEANGTTRVVTVRGAGGNFCAGVDIDGIHEFVKEGEMDDLRAAERKIEDCFATLAACRLPVVSLVEGYALAGGLELMLVTDVSVAAADAQIGDQHINRNLIPGGGSTQRLPRVVGIRRAKELIFTGKRISGTEASEWGLVNEAVPGDELRAARERWVEAMADKGRDSLRKAKYLVDRSETADLDTGLELEKYVSTSHFFSEEAREGLASFSEE